MGGPDLEFWAKDLGLNSQGSGIVGEAFDPGDIMNVDHCGVRKGGPGSCDDSSGVLLGRLEPELSRRSKEAVQRGLGRRRRQCGAVDRNQKADECVYGKDDMVNFQYSGR